MKRTALGSVIVALSLSHAIAQTAPPEAIEVTATKIAEPIATVPATITVIPGQELRDRQARDLASALALVPGVEAPPGGDAGPASAVPALLGLHEFDAFLLVVDGVPWGGAFNPSIATLDLTDVDRIEVLKGSAPVAYGATSFVGVIQVLHYPAGQAENRVLLGAGTHGQALGTLSVALPTLGTYRESITLEGASQGFADPREQIGDGKALYRGGAELGGGTLRIDLDLTYDRTTPPSPVIRQGNALTTLTPLNANYNPSDARVDENQYHAVLGYTHATPIGTSDTTVSYAFSDITDIRGFLRPTLIDDGSENADSQHQKRRIGDLYVDSHFSADAGGINLLYGADMLYGLGKQTSINGAYNAPLRGNAALPATTALHVDEINSLSDRRLFLGQYAQLDWTASRRIDVFAGARVNETAERLNSTHIDGFDPTANVAARSSRNDTRLSGVVGASLVAWRDSRDQVTLYADYRDTFKPAAIDFGPDFTPDVLDPETAQNIEIGIKGQVLNGALEFDASAFHVNFQNLVVATTDAAGNPLLQNAGTQRLQGVEADMRAHLTHDLTLALNGSFHDARFTRYVALEDDATINAAGKQLPLSPKWLGSVGLLYQPATGFHATAIVNTTGRRYLDLANNAPVAATTTLAASLGYRIARYDLLVSGTNLSNKRPPVTESEFGTSSYYLLPGRSVLVTIAAPI